MKALTRRLAMGAAAALLVTGGLVATSESASAATAGINMVDVCHYEVGSAAYPIHGSTAVSWRCVMGYNNYGVDLTLWCQYDYNVNAYASYSNFNDPYSWVCNY
jgi:hypothetical protein